MNKYLKLVGYGVVIWLVTFLVAFSITSLRTSNRPLFESIMPVTLAILVVIFTILVFQRIDNTYLGEGILTGVLWFTINVVLDLIMFLPTSPWQLTVTDYFADIGLTYLLIPVITIGIGYALKKNQFRLDSSH